MKDWEVEKVNKLYKQLDALSKENAELKRNDRACDWAPLSDKIDGLSVKLDDMVKLVESLGDKPKTTRKK